MRLILQFVPLIAIKLCKSFIEFPQRRVNGDLSFEIHLYASIEVRVFHDQQTTGFEKSIKLGQQRNRFPPHKMLQHVHKKNAINAARGGVKRTDAHLHVIVCATS